MKNIFYFTFSLCLLCFFTPSVQAQFNNSQLVTKVWAKVTGTPTDTLNWTNQTLDANKDLIVIGNNNPGASTTDMLLTKYNGSNGSIMWQKHYDNSGHDDYGTALVTDPGNYVYTATASYVSSTNGYDWVIQQYKHDGTLLWTKIFNSGLYDVPTDMKYDNTGYLYVTGVRSTTTTLADYCTIKYNASNGTQVWSSPVYYNYASLMDIPAAVTIVTSSKIMVTGGSASSSTNWDFASISYKSSTGLQLSAVRSSSSGLGFDQATAVAKDQYDNIYVTGRAVVSGNGYDIKIVKLDTSLNTVWSVTWDGVNLDDAANSIGVDAQGYIYVTGYTTKINGGTDYITLKYENSGTLEWAQNYSSPDSTKNAVAKKLDIDPYGNVLIVGDAFNIGNTDILTLAYDSNGTKKWEDWYGGSANGDDHASAIKIDDATDNFYVTGKTWTDSGYQYLSIKYGVIDYLTPPDTEYCPNSFAYYENKGQLVDDTGAIRNDLLYYCQTDYPNLYFGDSIISFQFYKHGNDSTIADSSYRFEMLFDKALKSKFCSADSTVPGYLNYFKPQCPTGATGVKGKQYLLESEIYDDIDVLFHGNSKGLKIYIECKPGGDPSDIILKFKGVASVTTVDTQLIITTPLGIVTFIKPIAYQIDTDGNNISLGWIPTYVIAGSKVAFTYGSYDTGLPLIIEMKRGIGGTRGLDDCPNNCEWSTFYEGTTDHNSNVRSDKHGSAYVVGTVYNPDFLTSPNAVQLSSAGFADAIVEKFDVEGHRIFATYFGGSSYDYGTDVDIDTNGNIFFTGYTNSDDFPPQPDSNAYFQDTIGCANCTSAFITKIDSNGSFLDWSTYFGGDSTCAAYGLKVDRFNNLFICGEGKNVPVGDSIGYFSSIGCGFIQKFNNDGVKVWGTTIGSISAWFKVANKIEVSDYGIYVCGNIYGDDLPSASNTFIGPFGISGDAFIIAFDETNYDVLWSRYIGGDGPDMATGIVYLKDYIYVTGKTGSDSSFFPVTDLTGSLDYYDPTYNGGLLRDIYLARFFKTTGAMDWCTYLGGSGEEDVSGMCLGHDGNNQECFYITGWSNSPDFPIPSTNLANAYVLDTNYGELKQFFSLFDINLTNIWGTYFGGELGTGDGFLGDGFNGGIAAYSNKKLFLTGNYSTSSTFPFDDGTSVPYNGAPPYYWDSSQGFNGFTTRFDIASVLTNIPQVDIAKGKLFVYPNPTDGITTIKLNELASGSVTLIVTDDIGRKVLSKNINISNTHPISIDLSGQASGMYLISVQVNNSIYSTKLIKQ